MVHARLNFSPLPMIVAIGCISNNFIMMIDPQDTGAVIVHFAGVRTKR